MTITTTTVQRPIPGDGTLPAYQARPDGEYSQVGVIVAHELFGVNADIRGVVDRLADSGFIAIAPEFYHRHVEPGRLLARDDEGRREGFALLHRMTRADALTDVTAAIEHLLAQPGISQIAMIGFSAGGHLVYLAASQLPIAATAVLYGGWLPSTDIPLSRPTPTLTFSPQITGRLLYLVGEADTLIDAGQREQIRAALVGAGVDHQLITYPGVGHAYFWPGTAAFDEAARDDSWDRILELLDSQVSAHPVGR